MFSFFKEKIFKIYSAFAGKIAEIFSGASLDKEQFEQLRKLLISSDAGVTLSTDLVKGLKKRVSDGQLQSGQEVVEQLQKELLSLLEKVQVKNHAPDVTVLVGINGAGKTTSAAKIAKKLKNDGKRVLLVAADTFRAAAVEQLKSWADRLEVDIFVGGPDDAPATVVFAGCERFMQENYDGGPV